MSFEPKIEKVINNYKRKIGEMQSQLKCKLPCIEGFVPKKILSCNAVVGKISGSVSGNVVNFDGAMNIQVLYVSDSMEYKSIDYTMEFKDRLLNNAEINSQELIFNAEICEIKAYIDAEDIKVEIILNTKIDGVFADSYNVLVSASGDGVYTCTEDMEYCAFEGTINEIFDLSLDFDIKDRVESILFVTPNAYISKVEPYDNFVKVYGEVSTQVTYVSGGDIPTVRCFENVTEFVQECALTNVKEDAVIDSFIHSLCQNMNVSTSISEDNSIVNVVLPIEYTGFVWNKKNMQVITDIYCTQNELDCNFSTVNTLKNCMNINASETISGSVSLDDGELLIDDILATCNNRITLVNTRVVENNVIIDGILSSSVIYKNNELNAITSYEIQLPFSSEFKLDDLKEGDSVYVNASILKVQAKARRGTDIEISYNVSFDIFVCFEGLDKIISNVSLLGEKISDKESLVIYIANSTDTIWDIAKKMNVSEDMIMLQNPNINLPIKEKDRVVIYKQLNRGN